MNDLIILLICIPLLLIFDNPNFYIKHNPYLFCDLILNKKSREKLKEVLNSDRYK